MAKRTRVKTMSSRPGARPASSRPNTLRAPRAVSAPLAPAQPMPSEVEATNLIVTDRSVPTIAATQADAAAIARSTPGRVKVKPNSLLAAKAATEYVYVGQDLRRIAIVGASLFGVLLALWILLVVLGLAGIY